jgi:demethylmenaquinone methyltransferase/2-methoxy-6-polyprenyl-1,4-benzoquinol methylase
VFRSAPLDHHPDPASFAHPTRRLFNQITLSIDEHGERRMNEDEETLDSVPYYAARAGEFEQVYQKPERQLDLAQLKSHVRELLRGHCVLEIACGTGYWTAVAAESAAFILATDACEEALEEARRKRWSTGQVEFLREDAFSLRGVRGDFTAAMMGFFWSHIKKTQLSHLIDVIHSKLPNGARVVWFDNCFTAESSSPIARRDEEGNTYQIRTLSDGRTFEVRKNYPAESEILQTLQPFTRQVTYSALTYYWLVHYLVI